MNDEHYIKYWESIFRLKLINFLQIIALHYWTWNCFNIQNFPIANESQMLQLGLISKAKKLNSIINLYSNQSNNL